MIFTIELTGIEDFRLQKNDKWRSLKNDHTLLKSDFHTENISEVKKLSPHGIDIEINGNTYKVNPTIGNIGEILSSDSRVFRKNFPNYVPSKSQLREVIRNGNDSNHNSLILNLDGKFELRQRPPFDIHINDPSVVLRHETFAAGNNYVGENAADDNNHIDIHFQTSLEGWLMHLKTGKTQTYNDFLNFKSVEQIKKEIEELREQWTATY